MKVNHLLSSEKELNVSEIYSEEVQDIISARDNWITRNGIGLMFGILLCVAIVSYFIRYPDIISASVVITSTNTPADIQARTQGRLHFFVKDGTTVAQFETLGYIQSSANANDILLVANQIDKARPLVFSENVLDAKFSMNYNLGEIQDSYISLLNSINDYKIFTHSQKFELKKKYLGRQFISHNNMKSQLERQKIISLQELALAQERYQMDSILFNKKVIPLAELSASKSRYYPLLRAHELAQQNAINNEISIEDINNQQLEIKLAFEEEENLLKKNIFTSYLNFEKELRLYLEKYIIIAPVEGKVSFFKYWNNNQNVNTGENILTIVPSSNQVFGFALVPISGSGKVKMGQVVNIKLDNYPAQQYGKLKGVVESISLVPREDHYAVKIKIDSLLVSTQKVSLDYKEQMKGTAEIITEDLRLIERLVYNMKDVFDNI